MPLGMDTSLLPLYYVIDKPWQSPRLLADQTTWKYRSWPCLIELTHFFFM